MVIKTPGAAGMTQRLGSVFGPEVQKEFLGIASAGGWLRWSGLLVLPSRSACRSASVRLLL